MQAKKNTIYTALILIFIFSCGYERRHKPDEIKVNSELLLNSKKNDEKNRLKKSSNSDNIDTEYKYINEKGNSVIVENSYPRGGQVYTDSRGKRYIYAVFWTRITNNTTDTLKLTIAFLEDYYLPSLPNRVFNLLIPTETFIKEKEAPTNYGLNLERCLDKHLYEKNEFRKIIKPINSNGFYVVALFNKGVEGTLRTGLIIENDNLFYHVNNELISCGKINLKQLKEKTPASNTG